MYGDLQGFRAFCDARGNSWPTNLGDPQATAALVRGSDFVRLAYGLNGSETDQKVIDAAYVAAAFEITLKDGNEVLLEFPGYWQQEVSGKILTKAGELGWTVTGDGLPRNAMTPKEVIDAMLQGIAPTNLGVLVV